MEDDLIRRVDVLKLIEDIKMDRNVPKNYGTLLDIIRAIRKMPIAYDVDKVMEQLDKGSYRIDDSATLSSRDVVDIEDAIEIVKAGGID